MTVATRRDVEQTKLSLTRWLAGRLDTDEVVVDDLVLPDAGYSNETVFCVAAWTQPDGVKVQRSVVLRVQPSAHQLFTQPDALFQARVMTALGAATTLPVPTVRFVEPDPGVLGAPFYVMDRVPGRIPPDIPSYHRRGWVKALEPAQRARCFDNGIGALAALHAVPLGSDFDFLGPSDGQDPFERYLDHLTEWFTWARSDVRYDADLIAAGVEYARAARPADQERTIVWGDARPGNIIFADDLSVAALIDWEGATIGPPGIDVGWWLMFEDYLCEAQGNRRLEGVPDRDATLARYEERSGRAVPDIRYYEVVAALVLSLITSRLTRLLIEDGLDSSVAIEYTTRVTGMLRERMDRAGA